MTKSIITRPASKEFISDSVTKRLASFVVDSYKKNYRGVRWDKCPILETTCYNQAQDILSVVNIPSDAYKMNLGFLEAIRRMQKQPLQSEIIKWEGMLLDLPLSYIDKMLTIDYLEQP